MRFRLDIRFNGSAYHGWQKQAHAPTVQGALETALSILFRQAVETTGCGRTDTGVHARFFPVHFDCDQALTEPFLYRLNSLLPDDIAVLNCVPVSDDFHARFSAKSRTYRYYIRFEKDPFCPEISWFQHRRPDVAKMNQCAALLTGTHDFRCFTKGEEPMHHGFECMVSLARWETRGDLLVFTVEANRFLRNMVRAMVGSLLAVGYNQKPEDWFRQLLADGVRADAGQSVPAHGLFLEDVGY
jgi:tRNA pseudouridine38-40 synthase